MAAPVLLRAAILVVSTTAAQDASTDAAIPALKSVFASSGDGKWTVAETSIVSDDAAAIRGQILKWTDVDVHNDATDSKPINLVVTTGGTGFAVSDVTPEAVSAILEKPAPGLVHGMLASSLQVTACTCSPTNQTPKKNCVLVLANIEQLLSCRVRWRAYAKAPLS